jgi:hypothetical protein
MAKQIGGTHYQSGYIHWDFVLSVGMQYLEGNATKYLARWDKKGTPILDLQKALSYVEKLAENSLLCSMQARRCRPSQVICMTEAGRFCKENNLVGNPRDALVLLATWLSRDDLIRAATCIRATIGWVERHGLQPVPLEDSNKHAERIWSDGHD